MTTTMDPARLEQVLAEEEERYRRRTPRSAELAVEGRRSLAGGVPLHWMGNWPTPYPLFMDGAAGAQVTDVDGHEYVDLCLGDTGAMFGHAHPAVREAMFRHAGRGATAMLPTADGNAVGRLLQERFGLPLWQLATSATDANRFAIRMCRLATGRDKVLVFAGKYHGSVDETHVVDVNGRLEPQPGVSRNAVDFDRVSAVVEFNDVDALEKALAGGDVACVLAEPAMTNIGIVPAVDGYHDALRELTRAAGTKLIIDETHTISTGPGGYTRAHDLDPDVFVLGKAIAGGIPAAVYGMTEEMAGTLTDYTRKENHSSSHGGFGGTLVGNALTLHVMRTVLEEVMTPEAYDHMIGLASRCEAGVQEVIARHDLGWHVTRLGARCEYLFAPSVPRNGGEAKAARNPLLNATLHLFLLNRGVLLTPFHSMVLMCPATTAADVDRHTTALDEFVSTVLA